MRFILFFINCFSMNDKKHPSSTVPKENSWDGINPLPDQNSAYVSTEMSLHVLAYNLKRLIAILGTTRTMKAVRPAGA